MSDLSQFGGGIDQPETETGGSDDQSTEKSRYKYSAGRCRSIAAGGRRCRSSASEGDLCYMHAQQHDPITIDSGPEVLIWRTGKTTVAQCRALQLDDERCPNGCGALELCCGVHRDTNADLVPREELDEDELDVESIRRVVHNLVGLGHEPLPVYEDGLWLPQRHAEADHLIVRAPTKTADSRCTGDEPRRRISPLVSAGDWDPDYLEGEGRTAEIRNEECLPGEDEGPKVGLKIAGESQRWFPVEIKGEQR